MYCAELKEKVHQSRVTVIHFGNCTSTRNNIEKYSRSLWLQKHSVGVFVIKHFYSAFNLGYSSAAAGRGLIRLESRMTSSSSPERIINFNNVIFKGTFHSCVLLLSLIFYMRLLPGFYSCNIKFNINCFKRKALKRQSFGTDDEDCLWKLISTHPQETQTLKKKNTST